MLTFLFICCHFFSNSHCLRIYSVNQFPIKADDITDRHDTTKRRCFVQQVTELNHRLNKRCFITWSHVSSQSLSLETNEAEPAAPKTINHTTGSVCPVWQRVWRHELVFLTTYLITAYVHARVKANLWLKELELWRPGGPEVKAVIVNCRVLRGSFVACPFAPLSIRFPSYLYCISI